MDTVLVLDILSPIPYTSFTSGWVRPSTGHRVPVCPPAGRCRDDEQLLDCEESV